MGGCNGFFFAISRIAAAGGGADERPEAPQMANSISLAKRSTTGNKTAGRQAKRCGKSVMSDNFIATTSSPLSTMPMWEELRKMKKMKRLRRRWKRK